MIIEFRDIGVEIQGKNREITTRKVIEFLVSEKKREEKLTGALRRILLMGEEYITDKYNLYVSLSIHQEFDIKEREEVINSLCSLLKDYNEISRENSELWDKYLEKNLLLFRYIPTSVKSLSLLKRLKKCKEDMVNLSIDYYIKILDTGLICGFDKDDKIFTTYGDVLMYSENMAGALDRLYQEDVFRSIEFSKEYLKEDHENILEILAIVALLKDKKGVKEASEEIPNLYGLKKPAKEFSLLAEKEYKIKITKK